MIRKFIAKLFGPGSRKVTIDRNLMLYREPALPLNEGSDRRIQLVLGLDFGTSFSKVVVGESRVRYAVPFDDCGIKGNPLLMPSALRIQPNTGECLLGINRPDGILYDNLKMPLIERDFSDDVQARAAAFLALVLRHTRTWLLDAHASIYKGRKIEWFINVGLPTDSYDDNQLTSTYCTIIRTAWRVSMLPDNVTLQRTLNILKQDCTHTNKLQQETTKLDLQLPDDRIHAFPEFSAQLAGYARSPHRRDGLHVTVDVGGGTLDVTVFNVHQIDGEDIYSIFARQVKPLGVRYLTAARLQTAREKADAEPSPFDNLPSDAVFMERFGITENQLENADRPFRQKVAGTIEEALRYTRRHRYPTAYQWDQTSERYGESLPGIFCGGGALANFYADLLRRFEGNRPPLKVRASQLPVPDDLKVPGTASNDYARLAVAYGLSFEPFDIGQIERMSEIDDICNEKFQSTHGDRYIGGDSTKPKNRLTTRQQPPYVDNGHFGFVLLEW